ncbi:hypothetical protein [Sphingomonas sp. GC_Shp_3]|uniref:hypothetical protein n=1 Tax=Sphingomonas sp. GC_Shp_3 TaxID=2937383 RepID=UPI002269E49B|nr:hypothetical protein [Sphingomonas sp. GC_Shp_3]
MTVINFALQPDGVFVVADTLVTNDRFEPCFFTSKVLTVPHLNALVCGTGNLGFILDWSRHLLGGMLAADVAHLDEFAPDSLRTLHAGRPAGERETLTSTIYHLGFDEQEERFVGFAYRSTADFASERLEYGVRTKPGYSGNLLMQRFPDDFVEVCRAQRIEQDQLLPEDRVFIGGHVVAYMMQVSRTDDKPPTVVTTVTRPFEFEDIDRVFYDCTASLQANVHRRA